MSERPTCSVYGARVAHCQIPLSPNSSDTDNIVYVQHACTG